MKAFIRPQDAIETPRLPQRSHPASQPHEISASALEALYISKTGNTILYGSDDEMDVIRHDTVHIHLAARLRSLFDQTAKGYVRVGGISERGTGVRGSQREESRAPGRAVHAVIQSLIAWKQVTGRRSVMRHEHSVFRRAVRDVTASAREESLSMCRLAVPVLARLLDALKG